MLKRAARPEIVHLHLDLTNHCNFRCEFCFHFGDLKAGRASIHDLLLEPPEFVETAKVFDMLLAVPKYGRVKVNKILAHCRIAPSKTIGGLSDRQRSELVALLHR